MGTAPGVGGTEAQMVGEMVAWLVAGWAVTVAGAARQLHMWDQQVGIICRIRSVVAWGPRGMQR